MNIPVNFVTDLILNKICDSNLSKTFHRLTKQQLQTFTLDDKNALLSTSTATFMTR